VTHVATDSFAFLALTTAGSADVRFAGFAFRYCHRAVVARILNSGISEADFVVANFARLQGGKRVTRLIRA